MFNSLIKYLFIKFYLYPNLVSTSIFCNLASYISSKFSSICNIYVSLNREEDAIEYYKKGHILGNNECKFNLAILYMKNNMEKEAVSLYKQLYKSGYEKGCYNSVYPRNLLSRIVLYA